MTLFNAHVHIRYALGNIQQHSHAHLTTCTATEQFPFPRGKLHSEALLFLLNIKTGLIGV